MNMKRIVFMGTPDFSVPVLQKLIQSNYEIVMVVTQPDRPKGRKKIITPPPVKVEALKHEIPIFQPEKLGADFQPIVDCKPDLIVTAAYGQLLPKAVLDIPAYGCINVHASLLPELRGGAPIHYAIMEGKQETGISIMYMAEKLDAGDVLAQQAIPIVWDDHVGTMHDKLSAVGATLLIDTLPLLFAGEITAQKQDDTKATFASNIRREQEKIDWNRAHHEIYNQIRGLHPWPVAFTTYQHKNMKIWWAEPVDKLFDGIQSGTIVEKDEDSFTTVCGNGKALRITDIQPAGSKRMTVKEYLLGSEKRIETGIVMGDGHA